jgi:hypothetical protein
MNYREEVWKLAPSAVIETADHLYSPLVSRSLKDELLIADLSQRMEMLGRPLNLFRQSVERAHQQEK